MEPQNERAARHRITEPPRLHQAVSPKPADQTWSTQRATAGSHSHCLQGSHTLHKQLGQPAEWAKSGNTLPPGQPALSPLTSSQPLPARLRRRRADQGAQHQHAAGLNSPWAPVTQ
ncbi:hypothetical protein NDU88_002793 [Pleurodeles waltl]|uniref:Uncharacterized protein n=1 Tax=Pleurodeles waltl TaxID=8319 RepID=A0AAV7RET5_PLEWA|nr:hypothetical protein NDU88_002793 [Pleurodeles waltl]